METRKRSNFRMLLGLVAVGLILSFPPIEAQAQDADSDGFAETTLLTLWNNSSYPLCQGQDRNTCLDPITKDLFVALIRSPEGKVPLYPFEFVYRDKALGGLGVAVHELASAQIDSSTRRVSASSDQKAIRVTESLDTSNTNLLGVTNIGTPNTSGFITVFTQTIINRIMEVCGNRFGTTNCTDTTGAYGQALIDKYIKHTIAHETGHNMTLRYLDLTKSTDLKIYNSIQNHYPEGTGAILDQFVKFTDKAGKVTFTLGDKFTPADQGVAKLK
jgi:hypothetical protein